MVVWGCCISDGICKSCCSGALGRSSESLGRVCYPVYLFGNHRDGPGAPNLCRVNPHRPLALYRHRRPRIFTCAELIGAPSGDAVSQDLAGTIRGTLLALRGPGLTSGGVGCLSGSGVLYASRRRILALLSTDVHVQHEIMGRQIVSCCHAALEADQ